MSFDDHPINQLNEQGAPKIFDAEQASILEKGIGYFEKHSGRSLSPGQVEMLQLETVSYMISLLAGQNQMAAESNLAAFAPENWLSFIGAGRDRDRIPAASAKTILRFDRAAGTATGIAIPAGTRVRGPSVDLVFLTEESAYLSADASSIDVSASASFPGAIGNGFAAGEIDQLVDPIVDIEAVTNTVETHSGADRETLKKYRARVALGSERLGDGLSRERYVVDVLDWSADCIDVDIQRPQAGYVSIFPLMKLGLPSPAELADLQAEFDTSNTHQGDFIQVSAPTGRDFDFTLDLKLSDPSGEEAAELAVEALLSEWRESLGGYIAPSELIRAARDADGVLDADIPDLAFTPCAPEEWRNGTLLVINAEMV